MAFINRENEIMQTIKTIIEMDLEIIVVGGYAVSGLAKHRFSVDCDIVISQHNLRAIIESLKNQGFRKAIEKSGFDQKYAGQFMSFKKKVDNLPITIDLLINSLVCRETTAAWNFDYIKKNSIEINIPGFETSISCRIPEKELLLAFKIHSGRKTDIRDIIMLNENLNLEKIVEHIKRGNLEALKTQIMKIMNAFVDPTLVNSLKGVFSLTEDVKKQIDATKKMIQGLLKTFNA